MQKKPISLSSVSLSIARPNLPVQQTIIIAIMAKKQWRKNVIKMDGIDWGCGNWLPKTKETFILADERMLKVLKILSLSICSSSIFLMLNLLLLLPMLMFSVHLIRDSVSSFHRWKTGTKLLFFSWNETPIWLICKSLLCICSCIHVHKCNEWRKVSLKHTSIGIRVEVKFC